MGWSIKSDFIGLIFNCKLLRNKSVEFYILINEVMKQTLSPSGCLLIL